MRLCGCLLLAVLPASAALEAGVAAVDLTPSHPVPLAWRTKPPTREVYHPLRLHALALADGHTRVVLVTADIGYFCRDLTEQIHTRVRRLGLRPHQVFLNASHNHSAPALCPLDDVVEPGALDYGYQQFVIGRAAAAIESALATRQPARLATAESTCDVCINRRGGGPDISPNPAGPNDRRVRLLTVRDAGSGALRAVVSLFACHPSDVDNGQLGADFLGFAQTEFTRRHPGVPLLTAQGAGGNLRLAHLDASGNKFARTTDSELSFVREAGATLAAAVSAALGRETPVEGPIRSSLLEIRIPLAEPVRLGEARQAAASPDPWKARWGQRLLDLAERHAELPRNMPYWIHAITMGADFAAVGLDGEVFVEYAGLIEKQLAPMRVYVFGYTNASLAYIPTAQAVSEGGYEVEVFYWWLLPARISPAAETRIVDAAVSLVRELSQTPARMRL
jgi:hypothetical protein